jgi:hypothetical protein
MAEEPRMGTLDALHHLQIRPKADSKLADEMKSLLKAAS